MTEIKERVGLDLLGRQCGTAPTAGFLIASLFWMQKREAQFLERVETAILPKDFLRFKLTGELGTGQWDELACGLPLIIGSRGGDLDRAFRG